MLTSAAMPAPALPPLREDLRLYPGPSHRDGSPSWRIQDPLRNAFFEIGWLEFELLARWRRRSEAVALIDEVATETTLRPTLEEVGDLVSFLATNQLLAPGSKAARETYAQRRQAATRPWYEQLLHHYLFFRLPLTRPDAFLARTVHLTEIFSTRGFWLLVLCVFGFDLFLLVRDWHSYTDSFMRMLTPQGIFGYALAVSFAKVVHELAHAYTAKRYGVRISAMGVAFLVMWPVLYTDTAETWKLADRRKQLAIASAGVVAELTLAVFASLAWALTPEGPLKSVFFVLATTSWLVALALNASPFMRFDGYFVLSDALDFRNLHERSSACARWWLRTTLFRLPEIQPEPMVTPSGRRWLIAFAITTWLYRLVVFIGIALLVYHFFFKLLGIVLMVVELWWFIFNPVKSECAYVWKNREHVRIALLPVLTLFGLVALVLWLVPITNQVTAPAILRAAREQAVYAPFAAQIDAIQVTHQQAVKADAPLLTLVAPALVLRTVQAEVAIASARAELARTPASESQQERRAVLEQQLIQALAAKIAVTEEIDQQELRAFQAGTVRDFAPDLTPGRWVNPRQLLMRVVSDNSPLLEAYVSEDQIRAIAPGQRVRFYPSRAEHAIVRGWVVAVDKSPLKEITRALLASTHGGGITVNASQNDALVPQEAVFRITIQPDESTSAVSQLIDGTVRIETQFRFVAENFLFRALSVLIRESGF